MTEKPKFEDSPGLIVRPYTDGWEARWQCRTDIAARGFRPKSVSLWAGQEPTDGDRIYIKDNCQRLQAEMLLFGHGGLPGELNFDGTLASLIRCYQIDKDSN